MNKIVLKIIDRFQFFLEPIVQKPLHAKFVKILRELSVAGPCLKPEASLP